MNVADRCCDLLRIRKVTGICQHFRVRMKRADLVFQSLLFGENTYLRPDNEFVA